MLLMGKNDCLNFFHSVYIQYNTIQYNTINFISRRLHSYRQGTLATRAIFRQNKVYKNINRYITVREKSILIEKLENNIHAGTKYLRFIIDRYYKDEPMDEVNKMLFTFASYNAGPEDKRASQKG